MELRRKRSLEISRHLKRIRQFTFNKILKIRWLKIKGFKFRNWMIEYNQKLIYFRFKKRNKRDIGLLNWGKKS